MADGKGHRGRREDHGKAVADELVLRITKEVVVKFIEVGRLSPANFSETFAEVHRVVKEAAGGDG